MLMESELAQAIQRIAQGLNQADPLDVINLIISAVSALATVAVLYYNHRTIDLAQKAMQQSLHLTFYEKMLAVANNIEKGNYMNTDTEIKLLFGGAVLQDIQEIRKLQTEKAHQDRVCTKYTELLNAQPDSLEYYQLENLLTSESDVPQHLVKRYEELDKQLNVLYSNNGKEYDWKKISAVRKQI